jgi:hypothetical protein
VDLYNHTIYLHAIMVNNESCSTVTNIENGGENAILFLALRQKEGGSDKNFSRKDAALHFYLHQLRPGYLFGCPNSIIPTYSFRCIRDPHSVKWQFIIRVVGWPRRYIRNMDVVCLIIFLLDPRAFHDVHDNLHLLRFS